MYYDPRHGGPYDRGAADSHYGRDPKPHYFVGATYNSPKVEMANMTVQEIAAYRAGFEYNEHNGSKKDLGDFE
jgi:hypothetical protein